MNRRSYRWGTLVVFLLTGTAVLWGGGMANAPTLTRVGGKVPNGSSPHSTIFQATAYTAAECGRWCDGLTATMTVPREGWTIACWKPYTKQERLIYIEGVGPGKHWGLRKCEDVGGAIGPRRLDIYYENVYAARQWGRRDIRAVWIWREDWE